MLSEHFLVDVQKLVKKLREKRKYMVQKKVIIDFCMQWKQSKIIINESERSHARRRVSFSFRALLQLESCLYF